jgi:hypothetical protein
MAEEGIRIAVIMKRAGHVSARMSDHYTHISEQAERREFERVRGPHRPPPVSPAAPDIMHPAIQAEIARQVSIALALRDHEERFVEIPREQRRPRLVVFPGSGAVQA